jgi:hypothetical protein
VAIYLQNISSLQKQSDTVSEDLCRLLPHYLIFIGHASGLLKSNEPTDCRDLVAESASFWHKPSDWAWKSSTLSLNGGRGRQKLSRMVDNAVGATPVESMSDTPTHALSDPVALSAAQLNTGGTLATLKSPSSYWYPSLQRYWICGECGEDNGNIDTTTLCLGCDHQACESCVIEKTGEGSFI